MKGQRIAAVVLLLAGAAALAVLQRRQVDVEITPRPLLYLLADTQREIERIPLRLTRVSDQEENELGRELVRHWNVAPLRHEGEAQRIADYLQQVGMRLTAGVERKKIRYRFLYIDQASFVNAAALPGGQIVIGRGMLELMETEDELASVLAHEIIHVDQRHSIERLQYEIKARKLGLGGLYRLGHLGVALFQAGYSKVQELEADTAALPLMVKAGYDPAAAAEMHRRFETLFGEGARRPVSLVREAVQIPRDALEEYFRSHPPSRERVAAIEREIKQRGLRATGTRKPMPIRAIFLTERGLRLDRHGEFDGALAFYNDAIALDAGYLRARGARLHTLWRMGNAAAVAEGAPAYLERAPEDVTVWLLFSRALMVTQRSNDAAAQLVALRDKARPASPSHAYNLVTTDVTALQYLAGKKDVLAGFHTFAAQAGSASDEAALRRRMAAVLYWHARLEEAEAQLRASIQRFPRNPHAHTLLALVLTELGRQADAIEALEHPRWGPGEAGPPGVSSWGAGDGTFHAAQALIDWRTGERDAAGASFRRAVAADPAWMVEKWVANHHPPSATAVFRQLQADELARRRREQQRRTAPQPARR